MTDPTREPIDDRVRSALRGLPLPDAPETLRQALETVPDRAAGERPLRRSWSPGLAFAAVIAVAVLGVAGLLGLTRIPPTPGATDAPTATAEPPASVTVLDAAQLAAAIEAHRARGLAAQWVVTSVGIDASRTPEPTTRACSSEGLCTVIGVLDGFEDAAGTVTIRTGEREVPPAMSAAELAGPIALRLSGTAPIQFLGHVDLTAGDGVLGVPELLAATDTAAAGRVVAVNGWLVGLSVPSCGPAIFPEPVPPFDCPSMRAVLTSEPVLPVEQTGDGGVVHVPADAVRVQVGAYGTYAQDPASDGTNDEPRRGLYLVRLTAVDTDTCPACRGWLMVGRLDGGGVADAPATAAPTSAVTLRSAQELEALLAADRTSWIGRPVFLDGEIDPGTASSCPGFVCDLGTLTGTDERVVGSPYTASLLLSDTDDPMHGQLALVVRENGLQYLGWLGWSDPLGYETTVEDLMDLASKPRGPMVTTVKGWLVAGLPTPCPAPPDQLGEDTPFDRCPPAWLTRDAVQPVTSAGGSISVQEPEAGVRVQYAAYDSFAPDPARDPQSGLAAPRYGTYVVRLVTDTRTGDADSGTRGWQVVGRLDPDPELGPPDDPGSAPTFEPDPTEPPDSSETARPGPSGAPAQDTVVPFGSITFSADRRTVTLGFVGGKPYRADDLCSKAYEGWAQVDGDSLFLAVADVTARVRGGEVTLNCDSLGYGRTLDVTLAEPFTGGRVEDLYGYVHLLRAPDRLAQLTAFPVTWLQTSEGDVQDSPTGRWRRTYTQEGAATPQAGTLELYEATGGLADVTGGEDIRTVTVNGADATLYRDAASGELVLVWSLDGDGLALVANEKDITESALIALAESAVIAQR